MGAGHHPLIARVLLPGASGALLALSLPPEPIPFLAPLALAPLAYHLSRLPPEAGGTRGAALAGSVTGGVHAVLLLHWLPGVALPLLGVLAGIAAGLAVWGVHAALTGAAVVLAHRGARGGLPLPLGLGAAWVLLGWLPAALPAVGLPWLGPEAAFVERTGLLGAAGLIGGAGLAGVLAVTGGAIGVFVGRPGGRSLAGALGAGVLLAGAMLPGGGDTGGAAAPVLRVAALSLEADPGLLADRERRIEALPAALAAVDGSVGEGEAELVVWPESPTGARDGAPERELALERTSDRGIPILFGALGRGDPRAGEAVTGNAGPARVLNRMLLAHPGGSLSVAHEKRRLVPGVEWAPPWEPGGIAPGASLPPFAAGGGAVRAGAAICFEALFPGEARRLRRAGAQVLFVAANEGWLGGRAGGFLDAARAQHRAAAVLLAVETRMPVVRSAVGGPAGAWDAGGRPLPLEVRRVPGAGAAILVDVPAAGATVPPASRGGAEAVAFAALLLLGGAGLRAGRTGRANGEPNPEGLP